MSKTGASRPAQRAVIESKLEPPPLPEHVVDRPRLQRLLTGSVKSHQVVVLSATAGAGKTTAVVEAVRGLDRPLAWLTLDHTDALPGRLVTYLEAALARRLPELDGVATRALAARIPHPEAAGLLVDAVGETQIVFVLDELERLEHAEAAWAVIDSFLRYAPASMRVVLLSRRDIPAALSALPSSGEVAWLRDSDLSFTVDEAAEALARSGATDIDATAAVEATGGWVTGVLFEAWRSADHVAGTGGETDPLHGYLAAHVLAQLAPEECDFLVATSLLDEVSAPRAEALGQARPGERLVRLRAAHLPVTWLPDRLVLRCHSRFREYLLECLERRGVEETRALRLAYGRLLAREGHHEEAAEALLRAGFPAEALKSAERVITDLVERLDLPVAERWLEALAEIAPSGASAFTVAELMLAVAQDDYRRAVRVADQLAALGERERLARSSERAAALMAWCYGAAGRLGEMFQLLEQAPEGPTVDAVRYVATLFSPSGERERPEPTGGPLDALVSVSDYFLGRLSELAGPHASRWAEAVARPSRLAALRASGQTRRAVELYEQARNAGAADAALEAQIGPEVLMDAGRYDQARHELARTRELARVTSPWLWVGNGLAEAKLVLRVDRDPAAARRILDRLEPEARRAAFQSEMLDTCYGLALLLEGDDAAALARLRGAVESMIAGDRILELPTAAVYLAEAEWRAGNEEAADRAADHALDAARRQGSNHLLLQALADFPAVVSRRIDAEPGADSAWHELGRALIAQGVAVEAHVGVSLELKDFGRCTIVVNGEEVRPALRKSYELLAYLASRRPPRAEREELLDALFEGRADDSTRAYLRQAVRRLRQVLPGEGVVVVEQGRVRLGDDVTIDSESARLDSQLAEAARLQGEDRLAATVAALAIVDQGEYLPGVRSRWADERRSELADRACDARYEAAELAFRAGRYDEAGRLQAEVLRADPYREVAWRLNMRIANALGDEDGVIRAYRDCERALAQLGAEPAPATRELLERMRR